MDESTSSIDSLQPLLHRAQTGDQAARDELFRLTLVRLELLAKKMLQRFSRVHRWVDTDDVLQNALLRLMRALEQVKLATPHEFFGLAAGQMRRELLDMARRFYGPQGMATYHDSFARGDEVQMHPQIENASSSIGDNEELEKWQRFHEAVESLPSDEREVVGLTYYHGWTQKQVAELFQINERTVRRRWESAMRKLHDNLHEE